MDYGCCDACHGAKVSFGFSASQSDGLELIDFGEEILDEVTPLIHDFVDWKRL